MLSVQWGNLAAVAYLILAPYNARIGAMVYALADGPLAAALIAWQSAWVFGSTEHSIRHAQASITSDGAYLEVVLTFLFFKALPTLTWSL